MPLNDKIDAALQIIRKALSESNKPAVMSSFGKDSMVVLDLIKKFGKKLPVIFLKEAHHPLKYEFSNQVIAKEGYSVYDYPPLYTAVMKKEGVIEILNLHNAGDAFIYLPTGIKPPVDNDYLCGLVDLYLKPKSKFEFPWDLVFNGQKSTDTDPMLGKLELKSSHTTVRTVKVAFPIADFSDADVWEYTERFNLPINEKRYNRRDNWREFEDVTYNPDYFRACTSCIDQDEENRVYCPKSRTMVPNISDSVEYLDPARPEYLKG